MPLFATHVTSIKSLMNNQSQSSYEAWDYYVKLYFFMDWKTYIQLYLLCLEFLQFGPRAGDSTTSGNRFTESSDFIVDNIVALPTPIVVYGRQYFSANVTWAASSNFT